MSNYKEYLIVTDSLTHDEVIQVPVLDEDGNPVYDEDGNPVIENKVIQVPNYLREDFRAVVEAGMHGEQFLLMITHTENPVLEGDTLVYGFNPYTGEKVEPFDEALYLEIRPLGNHADGSATGYLGFDTWAGAVPRLCGDEASPSVMQRLFPGTPPFDAEARHKYFDTPDTPASTGWGFRVELIGSYDTRDPSARAIGVYSDSECTAYLWTTGAFILGPSEWQTDDDGVPLDVWYTDSWDGDRPDEQKDWHIAFLLGSDQEGHQTLPAESDGIRYLFWEENQPEPPGGSAWVDTGATVIAQAGTLYRISDIGVAAALIPGQQIRFGDTAETTFTGTWAGGGDYLEIDPFVQAAVGDVLWSFE